MALDLPEVGVTPDPVWAEKTNAALEDLDERAGVPSEDEGNLLQAGSDSRLALTFSDLPVAGDAESSPVKLVRADDSRLSGGGGGGDLTGWAPLLFPAPETWFKAPSPNIGHNLADGNRFLLWPVLLHEPVAVDKWAWRRWTGTGHIVYALYEPKSSGAFGVDLIHAFAALTTDGATYDVDFTLPRVFYIAAKQVIDSGAVNAPMSNQIPALTRSLGDPHAVAYTQGLRAPWQATDTPPSSITSWEEGTTSVTGHPWFAFRTAEEE